MPSIARRVAEAIRSASGATVVVENRIGALTSIAAQYVARAKPDGYTVFVTAGNSTFAANRWLPDNDVRRREFRTLHQRSTRAFRLAVVLGVIALFFS